MDSYDEIFDFLNVSPETRISCLKHLLNSAQAKLNLKTKDEISKTIQRISKYVPIKPDVNSDYSSDESTEQVSYSTKIKNCIVDNRFASVKAEQFANVNDITAEQILMFRDKDTQGKIKLEEVKKCYKHIEDEEVFSV